MKEYFAGGNTAAGFVNYLPRYIEGLKNAYLLSGFPGCGKSSLIKRFVKKTTTCGYDTVQIHCSSDPSSLDGAVVPALSVGIFDATAPHTVGQVYPLALEKNIDLAQFASAPCRSEKSEIIRLTNLKKDCYRMGYAYLAAAGKAREAAVLALKPFIDCKKLYAFADRRIKECRITGKTAFGQLTAFGGGGFRRLQYACEGEKYSFDGSVLGVADAFFEYLTAETVGCKRHISFDATDASRVSDAVVGCTHFAMQGLDGAKVIHDRRFVLSGAPRQSRRLINELYYKAQNEFAKAQKLHSELEAVYTHLMDFDAYAEYRDKLIGSIMT